MDSCPGSRRYHLLEEPSPLDHRQGQSRGAAWTGGLLPLAAAGRARLPAERHGHSCFFQVVVDEVADTVKDPVLCPDWEDAQMASTNHSQRTETSPTLGVRIKGQALSTRTILPERWCLPSPWLLSLASQF